MTATTHITAPAEVDSQTREYVDTLRRVADSIDVGALTRPTSPLRLYMTSWALYRDAGVGKAAFLASRRAFPDATVEVSENYVELHLGKSAVLLFDKTTLGEKTTVTREVEEVVIDPELLAPVSA